MPSHSSSVPHWNAESTSPSGETAEAVMGEPGPSNVRNVRFAYQSNNRIEPFAKAVTTS